MKIDEYARPSTLEEAYQLLCEQSNNRILGGCIGLNCKESHIHTAIDIGNLSLNQIQTVGDNIQIGSMVTFHRLEMDEFLPHILGEAFRKANYYAGGVPLKNHITVGGAIVSKFGKSNFLTLLLALDAKVIFFQRGEMSLSDFLTTKMEKDILMYIKIDRTMTKIVTDAIMFSTKDYPILNVAAVKRNDKLHLTLGARPIFPIRLYDLEHSLEKAVTAEERELLMKEEIDKLHIFGNDLRASAEYRKEVAVPLLSRAMEAYYES